MLSLARAADFRRTLTALSMFLAPVVAFAWTLLELGMEFPSEPAARMQEMAESPGRSTAIGIVFPIVQILFLPVALGIVHVVRTRGVVLAHIGGILVVLGLFGHSVFGGAQLVMLEIAKQGAEPETVDLFSRAQELPALLPFGILGLLGFFLGFILLSVALLRSRIVSTWVPVLILGGLVIEFIGSNFVDYAGLAAGVVLIAAFWGLGLRVLRMSDEQWERPAAEAA